MSLPHTVFRIATGGQLERAHEDAPDDWDPNDRVIRTAGVDPILAPCYFVILRTHLPVRSGGFCLGGITPSYRGLTTPLEVNVVVACG